MPTTQRQRFAAQARWPDAQVRLSGEAREWVHTGESGSTARFSLCPTCASTLYYVLDSLPGLTAVAIGAFADPEFPPPTFSMYESRKHAWVEITGNVEHD